MATLFVGQNKVFLPVTVSTNSYAINLLKNVNLTEGTVVYTDNQTNGRGQRGNSWIADSSMNITLSVILKPHFLTAQKSFYLSKIAALAVYDVLAEILYDGQFDIKIKWPNDILVNTKKISGMLIENSFSNNHIQWSVIGIGLNVNQQTFEGVENATSLRLLQQEIVERDTIYDRIFAHLEKWYLCLRSGNLDRIDTFYLKRLFRINENSVFEKDGNTFEAKILGVDISGLLELEMQDRERKKFDLKEVKMIY